MESAPRLVLGQTALATMIVVMVPCVPTALASRSDLARDLLIVSRVFARMKHAHGARSAKTVPKATTAVVV